LSTRALALLSFLESLFLTFGFGGMTAKANTYLKYCPHIH
jgi:hypothetical protein